MASDLAREALEPCSIHTYAQEYEFRMDDGGGYTPTEAERAMIEDAINGFLSEPRARTAYDAIGSGVKALEWEAPYDGEDGNPVYGALSPVGRYLATDEGWFIVGVTGWHKVAGLTEAKAAAQADFERRVLSCLSTHTAAGAGSGCICQGCNRTYTGDLIVLDDVWERIKPADKAEGAGLLCASCIVDRAVAAGIWTCARAMDGDAGAGPVGEAVAPEDRAEQYIQAAIDRAPEPLRRLGEWLANKLDEDDWKTAERMLLGAATARPVEPGEVKRLTRERDEARQEAKEWQDAAHLSACEAHSGQLEEAEASLAEAWGVFGDRHELSLADEIRALMRRNSQKATELAETRERLAKAEEAHGRAFALANELSWNPKTRNVGDRVRAALTGDAQEAGR